MPLDGGSDKNVAAATDADAGTTPEREGEAAGADPAAVAGDDAEPETPAELDEPEAVGEYVDLEGLTLEPSAGHTLSRTALRRRGGNRR